MRMMPLYVDAIRIGLVALWYFGSRSYLFMILYLLTVLILYYTFAHEMIETESD